MIRQGRRQRTVRTGLRARPATNPEIQKWVARQHGFIPETDWIIHCKQLYGISGIVGLPAGQQYVPANGCPSECQIAIKQAFQHFGMLP